MTPLLKNLFVVLGLALLVLLGVYLYNNSDGGPLLSSNQQINNQAFVESQNFLRRLQELQSVQLSDELFVDPRFQSLQDFRRPVNPQLIGRDNPYEVVE